MKQRLIVLGIRTLAFAVAFALLGDVSPATFAALLIVALVVLLTTDRDWLTE